MLKKKEEERISEFCLSFLIVCINNWFTYFGKRYSIRIFDIICVCLKYLRWIRALIDAFENAG